jgi:hypothetical protein
MSKTYSPSTVKNFDDAVKSFATGSRSTPTPAPKTAKVRDAITYDGLIRKCDKKEKQTHTLEDALQAISNIRKRIGNLYAQGKFTSISLASILTQIDNATFFKSCGEFDRAVDQCKSCSIDLDNRGL